MRGFQIVSNIWENSVQLGSLILKVWRLLSYKSAGFCNFAARNG